MDVLYTEIGSLELWQALALIGVGVLSGSLGGMLGIGGGVVNIPMLTLLLGLPMHLAQAASMSVTPFVAGASALGHHRERAVCVSLLKRLAPVAVVAIIGGICATFVLDDSWLRFIFGVFLIWVAFVHLRKLLVRTNRSAEPSDGPDADPLMSWPRAAVVGGCFGFGAGLLGIGGGLITVPLLGIVCRLPLRQCIATSSAVMVVTSIVGAIFKDATIMNAPDMPAHVQWWSPLEYAAWLIPSCILSSWGMARLSHKLPLKVIRSVFVALVLVASFKLLT